jgi:hypothetical protein
MSFLAPSSSSAWMVIRLFSCFSLNCSICSLFTRSSPTLRLSMSAYLSASTSADSAPNSPSRSSNCLYTLISCYCTFAFIFAANPFPLRPFWLLFSSAWREKESSSALFGGGKRSSLAVGLGELDVLLILEFNFSIDSNFQGFFIINIMWLSIIIVTGCTMNLF